MGRSYTPAYRIEAKSNTQVHGPIKDDGWQCWGTWKTNERRKLDEWRRGMNNSFKLGGVNEHLSKSLGYLVYISDVRLIRQRTGEIVEEYKAPTFEVME